MRGLCLRQVLSPRSLLKFAKEQDGEAAKEREQEKEERKQEGDVVNVGSFSAPCSRERHKTQWSV